LWQPLKSHWLCDEGSRSVAKASAAVAAVSETAAEAQTVREAHTVSELVSSVARLEARIEELLQGMQMVANGAQMETRQTEGGQGGNS
jgi:hypothetical protein